MVVLFECCVDSVASALAAERGGAKRLELCDSLVEGGTTPSRGKIACVTKAVQIPVMVMIRPRGGDFCYTEDEVEEMEIDIQTAKDAGASGVVFGALLPDGRIDQTVMRRLAAQSRPLPVTFHRAIDVCSDIPEAIQVCKQLGIERILTSGGAQTCLEGMQGVKHILNLASPEITVLVGAGITEENAANIVAQVGCTELHGSMREIVQGRSIFRPCTPIFMGGEKRNSAESEYILRIVSQARVEKLCKSIADI